MYGRVCRALNIYMTYCSRTSKCSFCPEPLEPGSPIVVGKQVTILESGKRLYSSYRWHVNCWVTQGLQYLEKHPYQKPKVGRRRSELDADTRDKRLSILRRRAATIQRIKGIVDSPGGRGKVDVLIRLGGLLDKCTEEIKQYGGVPKSWT